MIKKFLSSVRWLAILLKRVIYLILALFVGISIYELLIEELIDGRGVLWPLLGIWVFTAYIVLPRVHRKLTKVYIPNYFIGRTRTADGLLGDPINIAVIGSKKELMDVMHRAGWTEAEDLSIKSSWKMVKSSILKKSYENAPVSSLFLFGNKQDLAFQIEVNGNPHARHHVRFWRTPKGWFMPGGETADWMGAATYDKHVGLSLFTGQITHKIDENIDEERNFIKEMVTKNSGARTKIIPHFFSAFRDRNGGGDSIKTDGGLLVIIAKKNYNKTNDK